MPRPRLVLTRRGLFLMAGAAIRARGGEPLPIRSRDPAQIVAGGPAQIVAGVVHYARLPARQLWEPLLERVRMAGLNAIVLPVPWTYHSPAPGFHDFTGPRDIRRLLTAAEHLGLWLIPHIGPWLGMGLDGGGVPAWLHRDSQAQPILSAAFGVTPGAPAQPFLRHVAAWWEQLLPYLLQQPNLLWLMVHPGLTADQQLLRGYARPLLELVRRSDPEVLVAMPADALSEVDGTAVGPILPWVTLRQRDLAKLAAPVSGATAAPAISLALLDLTLPLHWTGTEPSDVARVGPAEHPRALMASAWGQGHVAVVLDPMHRGVNWGWWAAPGEPTLAGFGAPLAELATPTPVYHAARRTALTFEALGPLLAPASPVEPSATHRAAGEAGEIGDSLPSRRPPSRLRAEPPHALAWWRGSPLSTCGTAGTVSVLMDRTGAESLVRLLVGPDPSAVGGSLTGDASLTVEDIPLGPHEIRILPLDWALFDGHLLSTTLEPVLHTLVAGRELLVLRNDVGGEIVLPSEYRHRHSRGPVYLERAPAGIAVHIDPVRIASALFDGPGDHALQILALEPTWADRVWPLDDGWRSMPYRPASWTPAEEEPARGVVIGPDLVIPEAEGGYRFLATDRGFGYRWGPWRGSDPHTWLAPLSWPAAPSVALPALDWAACPGAPEVLPDYDDRAWRAFAPSAVLTAEALGVDAGFIWYRAHFDGDADAVTLSCRHACDLFLNGEHIAALSAPPDDGPVSPKMLPLPARHLRDQNVLALLIEHQGRDIYWDTATSPHGLISFALSGAAVHAWRVRAGLTGEVRKQGVSGFADWALIGEADMGQASAHPASGRPGARRRAAGAVTWHRATFRLSVPRDVALPLFLVLDRTPTKTYLYLNGQLIGRCQYPQQAERRFWLPPGILREDANELLIAQWTRGARPGLGVAHLEAGLPALCHRHAPA